MEFQTKIIEGNKNPNAWIAWSGGGLLFLAMILMCIGPFQRVGFWIFGIAMIVLAVGAFRAKGDVSAMNVSDTDLVMTAEEIRIGESRYPVAQITDIVFQVEGYRGMVDTEGYATRRRSSADTRGLLNGMNNYLNFTSGDEKLEWQFYLPDPLHVHQLGLLFKDLYSKRISFVERSITSNRTFLFAPVSNGEWERQMQEHGYL